MTPTQKLIEVALPLEAINVASAPRLHHLLNRPRVLQAGLHLARLPVL